MCQTVGSYAVYPRGTKDWEHSPQIWMGLECPAAQKQTLNSVFDQWSLRTTSNEQTQMHWCISKLGRSLNGNDNKLQTDLKQSSDCYYGIFNVYTVTYLSWKWICIAHPFTNLGQIYRGEDSQLHWEYFCVLGVFKFQVLFVTYTTIQRLYNQQWNVSRVRSMDSANIEKYNKREVYIK